MNKRNVALHKNLVDPMPTRFRRLLVANRSEIAIRVFRAATELGIQTVAVYAEEDKLSLHRFKADEAYQIGRGRGPLEAYLAIGEVIRVAKEAKVDAIHPGYGFLSENPEFADACDAADIVFIGPRPKTLRTLGNKVAARNLARAVGVPVMPASDALPDDGEEIKRIAARIGYPLMLKASWGGGGRGMRPIESEDQLLDAVFTAKREAKAAFGKDEVYLEKLVRRARHVEVQIFGDTRGNLVHLFELHHPAPAPEGDRARAPYLDAMKARPLRGRARVRPCHERAVPARSSSHGCRYRCHLLHQVVNHAFRSSTP
jgi:pyruvate carboxylase